MSGLGLVKGKDVGVVEHTKGDSTTRPSWDSSTVLITTIRGKYDVRTQSVEYRDQGKK